MNDIDKITLEYFVSKTQLDTLNKKHNFKEVSYLEDKKFYKKRIIDLTKRLYKREIKDTNITNAFDIYIANCISYLKFIDKKDIIQDNYSDLSFNDCKLTDHVPNDTDKNDYLMFKEKPTKKVTLDNYVKKISTNVQKKEIIPKKQEYDLKNDKLKNKGIKKKKNINNIYEENKI
jgi:hypothetical protein